MSLNWLPFLHQLANAADPIALNYYQALHVTGASVSVQIKPDSSPVTQADIEIEAHIRDIASKRFPSCVVFGEELGAGSEEASLKLIVDPLDGTKNFIAGTPFFGTLLAIEENGELVAGLVSAPRLKERWWAQKGQGSFYNNQLIQVSKVGSLDQAFACHSSFAGEKGHSTPASVLPMLSKTKRQRGFGDFYAHMLVAMGQCDLAIDTNLALWDIAPLKVIVEEAGGVVTDLAGVNTARSGTILSSNGRFHADIVAQLK